MSRILENVHASAKGLHQAGFVDDMTMRDFDVLCLPPLRALTPAEICGIRNANRVSQAVFAEFLNVKPVTIAAWEQGTKKPSGTAVKILDLVKRKGLDVLR